MAQKSGINRGFIWLRKVLQITEETESPSVLSEIVRPTMDVFGWERLAGLVGSPQTITTTGGAATDVVIQLAVPEGVMRFVFFSDVAHDDPVAGGLLLSMQIRIGGIDIGLDKPFQSLALPARVGLERPILMQPGQQLLARSVPAPAAATSMFLRYRFVDLDPGEYLPPL